MMGWRITVKKTDGSENTYTIGPRIIHAFENHFKMGLPKAFANEQKLGHLFWLAWEAERSNGISVKPFGDDYLDTLDDVQIEAIQNPSQGTP